MRFIPVLILALALTGCEAIDDKPAGAVDVNSLAPLTSREQALIFGADGAMAQGNYVAAERDYLSAIAASTGHVDAHLALARLYQKQNMPEKQRAILEEALKLQPNHALANYMVGKLQLNANQYDAALSSFKNGRKARPDDMDLAVGEAIAQDMLGKHRAAQAIYGRVINNNPQANLTNVRTNLAMSYLLGGEAQRAVDVLKVDARKPDATPVARHNLALAYGLLGKHGDARNVLKGDMDEETRLLVLARLKEYLTERADESAPPPIQPSITEVKTPVETAPVGVVPVENKGAAKPVVKKAPVVKKPEVVPVPAAKPAPVAQ